MFQFLHAADIHLDSPLKGLERYDGAPVDEVRQATRRALANLVDLAVEQSVAFVLIAGDLYDGDWREFRTGLFFVSQMVRLREAEIPVYVIAGNHDAANKMTRRLPLPDNVHLLSAKEPETVTLDELGVAIHGQSFARGAVLENLAAGYPARRSGMFNVGLLHTCLNGREGHEPYSPCTADELRAKEFDYWALGHVHKRDVVARDPPIVFPGNTQGRHVRETGPKGCTLVTVDDHHRAEPEFRPLDVFRWEHLRIDAAEVPTGYDLLDVVGGGLERATAEADGRPLAVRVEVFGPCPAHGELVAQPHRWTNEIRAAAQDVSGGEVWIEKVKIETIPPPSGELNRPADGPVGELIRYVEELKTDAAGLDSLGTELAELLDKLPAELKEGPDAIGLDGPERLGRTLEDVEQMLVGRLLAKEGAS